MSLWHELSVNTQGFAVISVRRLNYCMLLVQPPSLRNDYFLSRRKHIFAQISKTSFSQWRECNWLLSPFLLPTSLPCSYRQVSHLFKLIENHPRTSPGHLSLLSHKLTPAHTHMLLFSYNTQIIQVSPFFWMNLFKSVSNWCMSEHPQNDFRNINFEIYRLIAL